MGTKCTVLFIFLAGFALGQGKQENADYFEFIKEIVSSETIGSNLVYRLDTLKSKFIPSRSGLYDYLNRDIELGFKHRRINVNINFSSYQIDLLCRNDSIFLSSITSSYISKGFRNYNDDVIGHFLTLRNQFYGSSKTPKQLVEDLSSNEEYAFYCGDGSPKTRKGRYVEKLVAEKNTSELLEMIQSLNCETQAFGVAGFSMLAKMKFEIPTGTRKLIDHIKKRNSELIICSGCLSGLVEKIYSKN